ncbi:MAG: cytochrome C [Anaerolineaceae bacterium]|nr:cytochrome C [Anaerolineaceae bacterium]
MLLLAGFGLIFNVHAQPPAPPPLPAEFQSTDVIEFQGEGSPDNEFCLNCHENPYLQMTLASGEVVSVTVDADAYADSVHGQHGTEGYRCIRCHDNNREYPHEEVSATNRRELSIELSTACARCHTDKFDETMDGVHLMALIDGNEEAAVCSDCHTGHEVQRLTDEDTGRPLPESSELAAQMCESCHADIYNVYANSVHGEAVLAGNSDAATCSNCHGVHSITGPTSSSEFRLFSPESCATCHADEELMAEYDISTDVFDTYVADFHGTTVTLFQRVTPGQAFNSPVCVDCHGTHNIVSADDPSSTVMKENLLGTCQQCHPDATANFSDAWLSHYQPDAEHAPLVDLVNKIYAVLIPVIIGAMILFVASDIRRRWADRNHEDL